MTFRDDQPLAWSYHRNTGRWPFNTLPSEADTTPEPGKEYPSAALIALPEPMIPAITLTQALAGRASCRQFANGDLPLAALGSILYAGYGVWGRVASADLEQLERPVPSAGGLYPLEVYVLSRATAEIAPGVYHYSPVLHGLEQISSIDLSRRLLKDLFFGQRYAAAASAVLVVTAVMRRSLKKYGDRGYRYVLLEAGHLVQAVNLAGVALCVGSCCLGGFHDRHLTSLLGIEGDEEVPLYAVALGTPETSDRRIARGLSDG